MTRMPRRIYPTSYADLLQRIELLTADLERERIFLGASQARERECERELAALREAAQAVLSSTVIVPMERDDDDDGPSDLFCVHPDALYDLRAALAQPESER